MIHLDLYFLNLLFLPQLHTFMLNFAVEKDAEGSIIREQIVNFTQEKEVVKGTSWGWFRLICSPVQDIRQRHIDVSVLSFYSPVKNFKTKRLHLGALDRDICTWDQSVVISIFFFKFNSSVERIIYHPVSHSILVFLPGGGSKPFPFHASFLIEKVSLPYAVHRKMVPLSHTSAEVFHKDVWW